MSVTFSAVGAPVSTIPCRTCEMVGERCWEHCDGTEEVSEAPECNFANGNAAGVLTLLQLHNPEGLWGELTHGQIPAALRRCMTLLASSGSRSHLVAQQSEEGGERVVRVDEDGMPRIATTCRVIYQGNTDADTVRRVTAVRDFFAYASQRGLDVSWD